jgi:hypothetical protein
MVKPANDTKQARAFWGMQRTLVDNLVTGVTEGFTKTLEISGVGYRAAAQGRNLRLQLGYSHDVNFPVPEGIEVKTPDPTRSRSAASTSRRWARSRPRSAAGASRSPTRARASNIAASTSSAKKARRSSHGETFSFRPPPAPCAHRASRRARSGKPRLSVHRSGKHIYAQVIDDSAGKTLAAASTLDKELKGKANATREGARRSARRLPSARRRPASPRSCSTVAASCSMAASRRWPMPRAKADWSFRW